MFNWENSLRQKFFGTVGYDAMPCIDINWFLVPDPMQTFAELDYVAFNSIVSDRNVFW